MVKRLFLVALFILSCICPVAATATEETTVDYTALFDKELTMNDGQIEGYYYEVNQIFHSNPKEFVSALTIRSFPQINSIAFAIATQENPSLDNNLNNYKNLLLSLETEFDAVSPEQETLYIMKLNIARMDVGGSRLDPLYFEKTRHAEIKDFYKENNRLFLLCIGEMGDTTQAKFADALIYELSDSEIKELNDTLIANSHADWATTDIRVTIEAIRSRINEAQRPSPPPTDPSPTEPAPTEPTHTESPPSTSVPEENNSNSPDVNWIIPVIIISAVLIVSVVLFMIRKKK